MTHLLSSARLAIFLFVALLCSSAYAELILQYEFASGTEGFNSNNVTGLTASGGLLTGTASNTDPQLILPAAQLPGGQSPTAGFNWTTVQYRVRETNSSGGGFVSFANASNTTGLAFSSNLGLINGNGAGAASYSFSDAGNGFTDVTIDISSYGSSNLTNFRLDPIGGATGPVTTNNLFEVDFVRFNDSSVAAVPEPGSLALLGFAGIAGVFYRNQTRRKNADD